MAEERAGERRLRRADRLRSSRDYVRLGREGARARSAHFVLLLAARGPAARGGPPGVRIGLTVSRKVGGAVARNRVKRRIRAAFQAHRDLLPDAADAVVIARPGAAGLGPAATRRELVDLFERGSRA